MHMRTMRNTNNLGFNNHAKFVNNCRRPSCEGCELKTTYFLQIGFMGINDPRRKSRVFCAKFVKDERREPYNAWLIRFANLVG